MNLYSQATTIQNLMKGKGLEPHRMLPATRVPNRKHNVNLGVTTPRTNREPPMFADVVGSPSIKMKREEGNGVSTTLHLSSKYADFMTRADARDLAKMAEAMAKEAANLSRGGLSYSDLRRRNHPYGLGKFNRKMLRRGKIGRLRGARGGISNMAIVNEHTGKFRRAWGSKSNLDKQGGNISLYNVSPVAGYLAFGTTRMKAHGAFSTVPARHKFAIHKAWRQMAKRAYLREMAFLGYDLKRIHA